MHDPLVSGKPTEPEEMPAFPGSEDLRPEGVIEEMVIRDQQRGQVQKDIIAGIQALVGQQFPSNDQLRERAEAIALSGMVIDNKKDSIIDGFGEKMRVLAEQRGVRGKNKPVIVKVDGLKMPGYAGSQELSLNISSTASASGSSADSLTINVSVRDHSIPMIKGEQTKPGDRHFGFELVLSPTVATKFAMLHPDLADGGYAAVRRGEAVSSATVASIDELFPDLEKRIHQAIDAAKIEAKV